MICRLSNRWLWRLQSLKSSCSCFTTAAASPPNVLAEYLIRSLGFAEAEALAAAKKVPHFNTSSGNDSFSKEAEPLAAARKVRRRTKHFRNDPDLIISFFEELGLNKPQIKSIVSICPCILLSDAQKTIRPKIKVLQEIGLSGSDLIKVLTMYKCLLSRPLGSYFMSPIEYLRNFLGSNELVCKAVLKNPYLLHSSTLAKLAPNILLLQKMGITRMNLSRLLMQNPKYLVRQPHFLEEMVNMMENKYKMSQDSKMFCHGILAVCGNTAATFDKKLNVFRSFGWSEENICLMFSSMPYVVTSSADRLQKLVQFFTAEAGCKPDYIATHPVLLNFSLEKRVKPRLKVMKILQEKRLINDKLDLYYVLSKPDLVFIKKYIIPYKDEVTLSTTDLEFLKDYKQPHKDEMPELYASNLKLLGKNKRQENVNVETMMTSSKEETLT